MMQIVDSSMSNSQMSDGTVDRCTNYKAHILIRILDSFIIYIYSVAGCLITCANNFLHIKILVFT